MSVLENALERAASSFFWKDEAVLVSTHVMFILREIKSIAESFLLKAHSYQQRWLIFQYEQLCRAPSSASFEVLISCFATLKKFQKRVFLFGKPSFIFFFENLCKNDTTKDKSINMSSLK